MRVLISVSVFPPRCGRFFFVHVVFSKIIDIYSCVLITQLRKVNPTTDLRLPVSYLY